ncbi:MAG: LysM peptidoglycan-binding domain-containing protein [Bryobacteraceae bacterium]
MIPGDTLEKIARHRCPPGLSWQDLARFNWGTDNPAEVNRALIEIVGCKRLDPDPSQTVLDPARGVKAQILIPRIFRREGLPTDQSHTIIVRKLLPPPAVSITKLDKWFIPGQEICDIHYYVEGPRERADKVDVEVYASHYARATPQPEGDFLKFSFTEIDLPIRRRRYLISRPRAAYQAPEWRGESEATEGALKPRPGQTRYINAAFSPYTILLRYFKVASDAQARIRLDPFWIEFE